MSRNILKPDVVWIEGRCYRADDVPAELSSMGEEHDLYETDTPFGGTDDEDDDFEVVMLDNARYSTNFHVAKHYHGSIIGKKGAIVSGIKRDTRTDIKIPRHDQNGDIIILGPAESNVRAARRRINIIVMSSRMKQKPTHFLSIPMNFPHIIEQFEMFKKRVLEECPDPTLEERLFTPPTKLHLTCGVMCLMDNEERIQASKLLTEARDSIVIPILQGIKSLRVRLKGIEYMNDDPKEIHVLYGRVQEEDPSLTGTLQKLVDSLVNHFYRAGFMNKEEFGRDSVKMHVTLMNTRYRNISEDGDLLHKPRQSFDGSEILKKFADYEFGVMEVTEIHLSQRHTIGPDGYYQPTHVIYCESEK